jgi:hypothetical protein
VLEHRLRYGVLEHRLLYGVLEHRLLSSFLLAEAAVISVTLCNKLAQNNSTVFLGKSAPTTKNPLWNPNVYCRLFRSFVPPQSHNDPFQTFPLFLSKVKVSFTLEQATMAQRGSRSMAPLFH